ncbi:MAG: glycosyltransferase family 2 protein [Phocaeicola sp.]
MHQNPKISVITVNYKGYQESCAFIESWIRVIKSVSYELIVVDNGSPTGDFLQLIDRYPPSSYPMITLIESKENGGFAKGNNLGIEIARGEYLFLINNDVLLVEDKLLSFLKRLEQSERIAALSPLLLNNDEQQTIQFAGYTKLSTITLRNHANGIGSREIEKYPAQQTAYLHGAAMLIKKSVVEKVGNMPEFYFLYYEEIDWSTQMKQQGYELWYDPTFKLIHKESCSTGKDSPLKCYYLTRNRLIYTHRFRKGATYLLALLYQLTIVWSKNTIIATLKGDKERRDAYCRGIKDFFIYIKNRNR